MAMFDWTFNPYTSGSLTGMFSRSTRSLARAASTSQITCKQCLRPITFPTVQLQLQPLHRYLTISSGSNGNGHDRQTPRPTHDNDPLSPGKPHRKQKTQSHKPPKRRLEAASQPLRNAPSSTRGPVLQCIAHTTAEKYDIVALGVTLRLLGVRWDEVPEGDRERAIVIGPWKGRGGAERLMRGKDVRRVTSNNDRAGEEEDAESFEMGFGYGDRGEIWVFNSGNFVTWGLTEEEGRAFLREVIRRKGPSVEIDRLVAKEYEVEEMDFVVDPDA